MRDECTSEGGKKIKKKDTRYAVSMNGALSECPLKYIPAKSLAFILLIAVICTAS